MIFRHCMFAAVVFVSMTSAPFANAAVLWDESVDGELTGAFGSAPVFNLSAGVSTVSGFIDHNLADTGELFDFDTFSVVVPSYLTLTSIQFSPGYTTVASADRLFFRIRPGAQDPVSYLWSVTINNSSSAASIAADVAAIDLSRSALTFNAAGSQTSPDFAYTWAFTTTTNVPEPGTWAMMIAGFGFVGGIMRRRSLPAVLIPRRAARGTAASR